MFNEKKEFAQVVRDSTLITQSILRKYIILPSLIIAKNVVHMLLFQFPDRVGITKCMLNLTDDIRIKILFLFCLKPWHRIILQPFHKDLMKKKKIKMLFVFFNSLGNGNLTTFRFSSKTTFIFLAYFKRTKKMENEMF
ncbi:hypothetical protein GQ457_16G011760 [Hibiscus cannabinus]